MKIRVATVEDAPRLLEIYAPYVTETAVSFEWDVPTIEEFTSRIEDKLRTFPYLVLEDEGEIRGYAYASRLIARRAYDHSAEATIYLDRKQKGKGYGRALYAKLEEILKAQGIYNLYACIGHTEDLRDPYLANDSEAFHSRLGYRLNGTFARSGYKFDRWYDMVWMEKILQPHKEAPLPFKVFDEVRSQFNL